MDYSNSSAAVYEINGYDYSNSSAAVYKINGYVDKINIQLKNIITILKENDNDINHDSAIRISKLLPLCVDYYNQIRIILSTMPEYAQFMVKMDNNVNRWDGKSVSLMDWITTFEISLSQLIKEVDKIIR